MLSIEHHMLQISIQVELDKDVGWQHAFAVIMNVGLAALIKMYLIQ